MTMSKKKKKSKSIDDEALRNHELMVEQAERAEQKLEQDNFAQNISDRIFTLNFDIGTIELQIEDEEDDLKNYEDSVVKPLKSTIDQYESVFGKRLSKKRFREQVKEVNKELKRRRKRIKRLDDRQKAMEREYKYNRRLFDEQSQQLIGAPMHIQHGPLSMPSQLASPK